MLSLEMAIKDLITGVYTPNNVVYGELLLLMRRQITEKIPTAAVSIGQESINLMINPVFFESLSKEERVGLLLHECQHIVHLHLLDGNLSKKKNMAMDVAINQFISVKLPDGAITVERLAKECNVPDIEYNKRYEYYLKIINDVSKDDKGECEGKFKSIDEHEGWGDVGEALSEEIKKSIIRDAMKEAKTNTERSERAGSVPDGYIRALETLNKPSVNWRQELRRFFAHIKSVEKIPTRRKRNRRYGTLFPGKKRKPKCKILVGVDTSGSVSSDQLDQAFIEIKRMYDAGAEILLCECDSQIHQLEEYKPKKPAEFKGGGGTMYKPIFDAAAKEDVHGLILIGDGDCWDVADLKKPNYPVLWAMYEGCKSPVEWGKRIEIKENKNVT